MSKKKNKNNNYRKVPSNEAFEKISGDNLTYKVRQGLAKLYEIDSFVNDIVIRAIGSFKFIADQLGVDYEINTVEIICPHMIDTDSEYISESMRAFMKDYWEEEVISTVVGNFKEVFLVQMVDTNLNVLRYVYGISESGEIWESYQAPL